MYGPGLKLDRCSQNIRCGMFLHSIWSNFPNDQHSLNTLIHWQSQIRLTYSSSIHSWFAKFTPQFKHFPPPFIFCYSYLIYCVIISFTFCLFFIHLSFCVLFCFLKRDFSKYHFSSWSLLACWFSVLEKLSRRPSSNFYFSIYIIYNLRFFFVLYRHTRRSINECFPDIFFSFLE